MEAWHMRRWRERYVEEGYNGLLDPASGQALLRIPPKVQTLQFAGQIGCDISPRCYIRVFSSLFNKRCRHAHRLVETMETASPQYALTTRGA